jgi:hypothetical protein
VAVSTCLPSDEEVEGEASGTFLSWERCDKENHEAGTHARGGGSAF